MYSPHYSLEGMEGGCEKRGSEKFLQCTPYRPLPKYASSVFIFACVSVQQLHVYKAYIRIYTLLFFFYFHKICKIIVLFNIRYFFTCVKDHAVLSTHIKFNIYPCVVVKGLIKGLFVDLKKNLTIILQRFCVLQSEIFLSENIIIPCYKLNISVIYHDTTFLYSFQTKRKLIKACFESGRRIIGG